MEVVASLSQDRTAAAQCGLFTYKSVAVIFEPPYIFVFNSDMKSSKDDKDIIRGAAVSEFILSLGTRCSTLVGFTPRLIYSVVRKFRCPLNRRLRGP